MDPDKGLFSSETSLEHEPSLEPQPSNINHGIVANSSASPSRSSTSTQSNWGAFYQLHHHGSQHSHRDHSDFVAQDHHQSHLYPTSLTTSDTRTRSTSYSGSLSLYEAHAPRLDHTGAPPIATTNPSHRNPHRYLQSHPHLIPPDIQRSSSDGRFQKPGRDPPFSPPFLHPLSLRTRLSRTPSPLPTSTRRFRDGQKPRTKFTIGSSRPNSPMEPEPKHGCAPTTFPSPFSFRGLLALSTFEKVVALLFLCCFFVLGRALLGVGHSAETCGVYAHEVADSGSPRSSGAGQETNLKFRTKGWTPLDRTSEGEQAPVWLERVEEMYGYQYGWEAGEYEVEHDDDGPDRYDDEYEHDDFLDLA